MTLWLSSGPIDREAEVRTRPEALRTYIRHSDARVVPVAGTKNLVRSDEDVIRAGTIAISTTCRGPRPRSCFSAPATARRCLPLKCPTGSSRPTCRGSFATFVESGPPS